jgi:hypothetical protein
MRCQPLVYVAAQCLSTWKSAESTLVRLLPLHVAHLQGHAVLPLKPLPGCFLLPPPRCPGSHRGQLQPELHQSVGCLIRHLDVALVHDWSPEL